MDWKAFDKLSYGLYLITTKEGDQTAGCVVNTLTQATVTPPQVTVTINKDNCTARLLQRSGVFAATALCREATMDLIGTFGFHSSEDTDKLAPFETKTGANGVPYVCEQAAARFGCRVKQVMDAGTHLVFLAEVEEAELLGDEPMTYAYYHEVKKGRTPPKASSYRPEEPKTAGYRCKICGYILESDTLPDDFVCPICGQSREQFEKITG